MTFYIIDSIIDKSNYLRVEDQSGTVWRLHPHTGLLTKSELPSISQQTSNNFWVPFKSGCSVDMKTARSNCPSKALTLDLDVQQFLHSLGPMYNLNEIANLMKKPSKSVYQQPEILYLPTVQSWMWIYQGNGSSLCLNPSLEYGNYSHLIFGPHYTL